MRSRAVVAAVAGLLVGCSGGHPPVLTGSTTTDGLPASSPLVACVEPHPTLPPSLKADLGSDFDGSKVTSAVSLDGGRFRADPPPDGAAPKVGSALALCSLLATATQQNSPVLEAATRHGMAFGLGVVTIAADTQRGLDLVAGTLHTRGIPPYRSRLAWLAVTEPDVVSSCPAMITPTRSPQPGETSAPVPVVPPYQIVVIDAQTGEDGVIYTAKTNQPCGGAGYTQPTVSPAVEFESLPWTLISRGPGPKAAMISYPTRSCDDQNMARFVPPGSVTAGVPLVGTPAVFADRDHPGLIRVVVERALTRCGPPMNRRILLRSADLQTDLPEHLVHAPVGAIDVPGSGT